MSGRTRFEFELGSARARKPRRPDEESPMRILVMGDFGGRAQRRVEDHSDLARRKPAAIDVDNFDRVMARIAPRLLLPVRGDQDATLEFAAVDHFHPDTLYRRLALFQKLREARQRVPDAGDFARLLGNPPPAPMQALHSAAAPEAHLQALIREVVAPHIVPQAPPQQAVHIAMVDAAMGEQMRAIVQDPQFKALEVLWRGVQWLVSNLETDEQLKLYLLDASREELAADPDAARGVIESSGPWSLLVGNYAFGLADEDVELLARLGALAAQAGGPFLAAAKSELIGCQSIAAAPDPRDWTPPAAEAAERWNALRDSAIAPWIGLALPRMLLRLPYGKASDPIESFPFDELSPRREHEAYLWGNGALACAQLIGRAFASRGWDMEPGDELDVEDLPAHTHDDDGEKCLQACAEVNLIDRAAEAILDAGLIPLLSHKHRNAVRVMRFQSIAKPAQALHGPWS